MDPVTIGQTFNPGKIARIQCIKNDLPEDLSVKNTCFLLLIVCRGTVTFAYGDRVIEVQAPAFVCFDEMEDPICLRSRDLVCHSIWFHPAFFNVNLTFERIHTSALAEVATVHDFFLMKPFTDRENFVFPISDEWAVSATRLFWELAGELAHQRDDYWSCRSRTYFIQIIFLLERTYGLVGEAAEGNVAAAIEHPALRSAVLFIEGHYTESLSRMDIAGSVHLNQTTLDRLFRSVFDMTAMEYLWHHRITVAKRQLRFTRLPVSEIAAGCGFKTLPHFCRRFEKATGVTPSAFRETAVNRRISAFGKMPDC